MQTALIVAMDQHGLIGTDSGLPWDLPRDLKRFRKLTLHKPILMGRRTHEMIGKELDQRLNLVLSRDPDYRADGCRIVHSLEEGFAAAREYLRAGSGDELLIIGGAQIYREALPLCERLYLTVVQAVCEGSVYFPLREAQAIAWRIAHVESHEADERNALADQFFMLDRATGTNESLPLFDWRAVLEVAAESL
jgi:dihydrofolate reductase